MNANDALTHYTGTTKYYRYHQGLLLTEGAKAMADHYECYWLLDVIASYQPKLHVCPFQVWQLVKGKGAEAVVFASDGNGNTLKQQYIPYTDFGAKEGTLWVVNRVVMLPSEY
jgi:hypothetical protein